MSTESDMITRLAAKQDEAQKRSTEIREKRTAIVTLAKDEGRDDLNETEDIEFAELGVELKTLDEEIVKRSERMAELADDEKRAAGSAAAFRRAGIEVARISNVTEGRMYEKGNGRSFLMDVARASVMQDHRALERLQRHETEMIVEGERRDLSRTDGAGGFFIPPVWLMDEYEALARAGRPTANLVTNLPLPPGTDSINVPKISTGTTTAIQTADNAAVSETDLADTSVSAGVKTIAGQQSVAIQALEQSPVNFDQVIFADLMADYATKVDVQVLAGSNANGQVKGIIGATGINAITYTDASPTVGELYSKIADAVQQIHTGRFLAPNVIIMHPRRWAWFLAAVDTNQRPLVVPNAAQGPTNAIGTFAGVVAEQVVGSIQGLPVVTDPSIAITQGAGTNQDYILVMRTNDSYLWEGAITTRALPEVKASTLEVVLQVYGYLAFTAERQVKSVSYITGTGLTAPVF